VIYNVGRGNAICEKDLIQSLDDGSIEAAYLDVVKTEPLPPDSPLRNHPDIFIMPHASAISPNYLCLFINEFIEKYEARYTMTLENK
jgi:phosphoglycerate dehydrogenase-like enzyme